MDSREEIVFTALDLFSGCGGLTLGLKRAGFKVLGAVEIDPFSIEAYRANHKDVTVWKADIRDLTPAQIQSSLGLKEGDLDLLAGCPPCQGFSTMRTLNGALTINDPRNDLLLEVLRFVDGLRPKTVMIENVPGLANDDRFRLFWERMAGIGYKGNLDVFNAAKFGVPQRRRRLIYLAGHKQRVPFAKPLQYRVTVQQAIGDLPQAGASGDALHDIPERRTPRIIKLIQRIPKDGGSRTDLTERDQLDCHKRCNGFKDVYGRMAWNDVAPTITSGCFNPSKGRFLHPQEDRAITMREAALLQGFPRQYVFPTWRGKSAVAMLIGNALPPPLVAAHARVVRDSLRHDNRTRQYDARKTHDNDH